MKSLFEIYMCASFLMMLGCTCQKPISQEKANTENIVTEIPEIQSDNMEAKAIIFLQKD
jgi:hypothetical protein